MIRFLITIFAVSLLQSCLVPGAPHKYIYKSIDKNSIEVSNEVNKVVTNDSIIIYTLVGVGSYPRVKYPGAKIAIANYSEKPLTFDADSVFFEVNKSNKYLLRTKNSQKRYVIEPYNENNTDSLSFISFTDTVQISDRKWSNIMKNDTIKMSFKFNDSWYELKYILAQ